LVAKRAQISKSVCPSLAVSSSRIVLRVESAKALKTSPNPAIIGKSTLACQESETYVGT
jgi:hypothetical protein